MNRFIRLLSSTLPFFAAEAIQYIVVNILLLSPINPTYETLYLYSVAGIVVCGIIFVKWYLFEIHGEDRCGLKMVINYRNVIMLLMMGIGCQLFFSGFMSLLVPYLTKLFQNYTNVVERLTSGNFILVALLVVFIAPITEELIFRGVILHMANRSVTFAGANILQAFLFGIYHGNLVQGIYAALLGYLLGLVCYRFNTIYASILLHIIINSSAYLIAFLPNTKLSYYATLAIGTILLATSLPLLKSIRSVSILPSHKD